MKLKTKTNSLLFGLCVSLTSPLVFAESFNAKQVETLRKQGKAQQAYELALRYRAQLEGDAAYDFAYGMAAIDAGKLSEGVLALERVVLTTPKNVRARVELARAYFLLREDTRARQEFEIVLATKPPTAVVNNIKRFLRIIRLRESEYQSTASAYVELGFGHDTNINSAPIDASFVIPVGVGLFGGRTITLGDDTLETQDEYLTVTTGGKLVHPFEPGKQLILGADVSARFNSSGKNFDTENWSVYAGVKWRAGDMTYGVTGQVQEFELNDADNRSLISLTGDVSKKLNKQTNWSAQLQVAQLGYPGQGNRDSSLYILGSGLTHQYAMKWRPTVAGSVHLGIENAHNGNNASRAVAQRNFVGARAALQVIPTSKMSVSGSLSVEYSHYEGENVLTDTTRNDYLYQASINSRYIIDDNWSLGAGVYYTRSDSNSVLNDYDRTRAEVSARYTF